MLLKCTGRLRDWGPADWTSADYSSCRCQRCCSVRYLRERHDQSHVASNSHEHGDRHDGKANCITSGSSEFLSVHPLKAESFLLRRMGKCKVYYCVADHLALSVQISINTTSSFLIWQSNLSSVACHTVFSFLYAYCITQQNLMQCSYLSPT